VDSGFLRTDRLSVQVEPTVFIVLVVFAITFFGVAYGLKTRRGSGINHHPGPDSGDPPQDPDPDESGQPSEPEREESTLLDQHGMK
jgi:hypothetical protein